MKQLVIGVAILCLTAIISMAQSAPGIQWQHCFGGSGNDVISQIIPTNDGGFVFVGITHSKNDGDISGIHIGQSGGISWDTWVVKVSADNILEWQKCLGGSSDESFRADIVQTHDNGYAIATGSASVDGDLTGRDSTLLSPWVIKLFPSGEIEWQHCFGHTRGTASSIVQLDNGEYVIGGSVISSNGEIPSAYPGADLFIARLSATGVLLNQKVLGGRSDEGNETNVTKTSDGGFILGCGTSSNDGDVGRNFGMSDIWIVKFDSTFAIQWKSNLGGSGSDSPNSILQTYDGGYIISGSTNSFDSGIVREGGDYDAWIIKLAANGKLQWQKSFGLNVEDRAYSAIQTSDSGIAFVGGTKSFDDSLFLGHNFEEVFLVKLNSLGEREWQRLLGSNSDDYGTCLFQKKTGELVIGAVTSENKSSGDVFGGHGNLDCWVVVLGAVSTVELEETGTNNQQVYPNPATTTLHFASSENASTYKIVDMLGRTVMHGVLPDHTTQTLDVSSLLGGMYYVFVDDLQGNHPVSVAKVMIMGN